MAASRADAASAVLASPTAPGRRLSSSSAKSEGSDATRRRESRSPAPGAPGECPGAAPMSEPKSGTPVSSNTSRDAQRRRATAARLSSATPNVPCRSLAHARSVLSTRPPGNTSADGMNLDAGERNIMRIRPHLPAPSARAASRMTVPAAAMVCWLTVAAGGRALAVRPHQQGSAGLRSSTTNRPRRAVPGAAQPGRSEALAEARQG